jgi:hypothetical protein
VAERLGPPPKKADERFDNWVFRLWKRAFGALDSGDIGVTAPITVTTSGTGTLNIGHGTSGAVTGTYGSQSRIPILAVDTYGHITLATSSDVAIAGTSITGSDLTVSSPLTGTATNALLRSGTIGHGTSGAIPGTYGSLSSVPIFAVNTWGHVVLATASAIAIAGTAVTGADLTVSAPLTGTATNALLRAGTIGHGTSGVTGGSYGGATNIPRIAVDTWGHITAVDTFSLTGTAITGADVSATTPILLSGTSTNAALRPFSIAHATSGAIPATYGAASQVAQVTVDTYGHVTAATGVDIAINGTAVTGANLTVSSPLVGTATNALLRAGTVGHGTSGVIGGTYGGASGIPRVGVDTWGHVTVATSFPLQATAPILVGSNAGTFTWGHSTSGAIPGTYGSQSAIPIFVVNTWGHVTLATSSAGTFAGTSITGSDLTFASPILGTATNAVLRGGTIAHATSGIVTGTYGSISIIPQVVVNTWGHVTAINTFGLTGTAVSGSDLTISSPLVGTATNALLRASAIAHGTSGAIPGTYGSQSAIPILVVSTYGHVTLATSSSVAIAGTAVTGSDLTFTSPIIGTATNAVLRGGTIAHALSGVVASTYGGALGIPRVIVDTWGHITAGTSFPLQATAPIIVGSNAGTFTWGHSTSGVTTGTYGAANVMHSVGVDTYGHVTALSTFPLAGTAMTGADLSLTSPLIFASGTGTNVLLRAASVAHATSGIVSGTYGGSGVTPQIVVNTWGHVTAINTFGIDAGSTDYPMVKGSVPDGSSVTIGDGYQLLCVEMTVFGTGTIIVEGTGILAIL